MSRCNQNFEAEDVFPVSSDIDCSKKVKEHFENTPHLKGEKNQAGYQYWYGLDNVLGFDRNENDEPTKLLQGPTVLV